MHGDRRLRLEHHVIEVGTAIDRLADEWEQSRATITDDARHIRAVSHVQQLMASASEALCRMENDWRWSVPKHQPRRQYAKMPLYCIAECIAAYRFRMQIIARINALFSQRALAERYGVSKRTIEGYCEGRTGIKR